MCHIKEIKEIRKTLDLLRKTSKYIFFNLIFITAVSQLSVETSFTRYYTLFLCRNDRLEKC